MNRDTYIFAPTSPIAPPISLLIFLCVGEGYRQMVKRVRRVYYHWDVRNKKYPSIIKIHKYREYQFLIHPFHHIRKKEIKTIYYISEI